MRKNLLSVSLVCLTLLTIACNRNAGSPESTSTTGAKQASPTAAAQLSPNPAGHPMTTAMSKSAGDSATDCGRVPASGDPAAASECAMKSFNDKKPFFVRYDLPLPDAEMAIATVRSADGKLSTVQYDSKGWEKPQEGGELSADKKIASAPCPTPNMLRVAGSGRVTCYPPTQMPAGMSPHGGANGMKMPPATGESPHGGAGMPKPPAGTPNPHKTDATKSH